MILRFQKIVLHNKIINKTLGWCIKKSGSFLTYVGLVSKTVATKCFITVLPDAKSLVSSSRRIGEAIF